MAKTSSRYARLSRHITSFKWTLVSIFSIIVVYGLHEIINKSLQICCLNNQRQDQTSTISRPQPQPNAANHLQEEIHSTDPQQNQTNTVSTSQVPTNTASSLQCQRCINYDRCYSIWLHISLISGEFVLCFFHTDV